VLLSTPPTAPESAYRVVEPLQNAAPERRVPPSWPERRHVGSARRAESPGASNLMFERPQRHARPIDMALCPRDRRTDGATFRIVGRVREWK
jgi:hypothetical protein